MEYISILADIDFCGSAAGQRIFGFIGYIINIIQISIPILLILLGTIDLVKATVSQKDDEMKKAQSMLIKRIIYALIIFFIPILVKFLVNMVAGNEFSDSPCLHCLTAPSICKENGEKLAKEEGTLAKTKCTEQEIEECNKEENKLLKNGEYIDPSPYVENGVCICYDID